MRGKETTIQNHGLFQEIRRYYELITIDPQAEAVIVLSGPPASKGGPENYHELNQAKVALGIKVLREIVAHQVHKTVADLVPIDYFVMRDGQQEPRVRLIVDGEEGVILEKMVDAARRENLATEIVVALSCGKEGEADTRHNFRVINKAFPLLERMTIVTGVEHVARAIRTGLYELNNKKAVIHGIGYCHLPEDPEVRFTAVLHSIRSELAKIREYHAKGELVINLPEGKNSRGVPENELLITERQ